MRESFRTFVGGMDVGLAAPVIVGYPGHRTIPNFWSRAKPKNSNMFARQSKESNDNAAEKATIKERRVTEVLLIVFRYLASSINNTCWLLEIHFHWHGYAASTITYSRRKQEHDHDHSNNLQRLRPLPSTSCSNSKPSLSVNFKLDLNHSQ